MPSFSGGGGASVSAGASIAVATGVVSVDENAGGADTPAIRATPTDFQNGTTTAPINLATIGALPGDLIVVWAYGQNGITYTAPLGFVGVTFGTTNLVNYSPFSPGSGFDSIYKYYNADIQGVENLTATGNIFGCKAYALYKPSGLPVRIDNWNQGNAAAGSGPVTVPALTTNRKNSLIIFGGFQDGNGASTITLSTGSGVTSDFTGNAFFGHFTQTNAGAVQALQLQSSQSAGNHWAMIAMSFC